MFFLFSDIPAFKGNESLSYESGRNEKVSVKFIPDDALPHVRVSKMPHICNFPTSYRVLYMT